MSSSGDSADSVDRAEDLLMAIRSSLREGGPQVDAALLVGFIDKSLAPDDMVKVDRFIREWRNWNFEYCNLFGATLEPEVDSDTSGRGVPQSIIDYLQSQHSPASTRGRGDAGLPESAKPLIPETSRHLRFRSIATALTLSAAAVFIVIGVSFFLGNKTRVTSLDLEVLASATRSNEPATQIERDSDGTFLIDGDDFYLKLRSPIQGVAVIVVHSRDAIRIYPREFQREIAVSADSPVEFGPLITPHSSATVTIVVAKIDLHDEVKQVMERNPNDDLAELKGGIVQSVKAKRLKEISITSIRIQPGKRNE